jgi:hypothetical protein
MKDYLYKFPDEIIAQTVLSEYYTEEGWQTGGEGYALDVVGVLTSETGEMDEEGNAISAPLDGWHVNLRVTDARRDPAKTYRVTPDQQRRVWL